MPQHRIKGLIFDMDGTIVDSMPVHLQAWMQFLSAKGINLTPEEFETKNRGTITEIITAIFGTHLTPDRRDALGEEKEALFRSMYRGRVEPVSGFPDFLRQAHAAGLKIALASMANRKNIDMVLDELGLGPCFHAIVSGDDVMRGKPDPEVFQQALRQLDLHPHEAVVFEDARSGIDAAAVAGIRVIGLATMHRVHELTGWGAEKVISTYRELDLRDPLFGASISG